MNDSAFAQQIQPIVNVRFSRRGERPSVTGCLSHLGAKVIQQGSAPSKAGFSQMPTSDTTKNLNVLPTVRSNRVKVDTIKTHKNIHIELPDYQNQL